MQYNISMFLCLMKAKGQQLYETFFKENLVNYTVLLTKPITRNNILPPSNSKKKGPTEFGFIDDIVPR